MNGWINLLKPPGMTSNDAVMIARRILRERRIGHAGTLDPEAAGVLPLAVGRATRLVNLCAEAGKTYWFELAFGCETDTCDAHGTLTRASSKCINEDELMDMLPRFVGRIQQQPPMYSALKHQGKRLYELAREGIELDLPAREIVISELTLLSRRDGRFLLRMRCGGGTYVRSVCRDLGRALGSAAHMGMLVREGVGRMDIRDALTIEQLERQTGEGSFSLLPMAYAADHLPSVVLPDALLTRLRNGNPLPVRECGAAGLRGRVAVMHRDEMAALGECDGASIRILAMLMERV